ncbi:MAG: ferrous iron transport protein B [Planctomycetota bacterium]
MVDSTPSQGDDRSVQVALAGNPNAGKTTIFNALAGTRQHVGNYPGVTVEKKESYLQYDGCEIHLVDLPGTYSLTATSMEERVARDFVIREDPDVVVDVIDASNLERNLYLAVQFMELGVPLVLVFNMSDVAEAQGMNIDIDELSDLLGVEIVSTVGHRGEGIEELKKTIIEIGHDSATSPREVTYGAEIEEELDRVISALEEETGQRGRRERWTALKLMEGDPQIQEDLTQQLVDPDSVFSIVSQGVNRIKRDFGEDPEVVIADRRYGFISGACMESVQDSSETRHTVSDRIDSVLTHRVLGLPIFLGMMYLVFKLTFTMSEPLMGLTEGLFEWLGGAVGSLWPAGSESVLRSLVVDGIIGGVGGVLVFFPVILMLFLAISILEDSGYMARAAFIMDRLMHKIGLHGRSFIPMLLGFGCTVPAIMATRTMDSRRDRLTTILVLPLMSCGARLPIYALFIPAFFPEGWRTPILWSIYLIGIVLAVLLAKLLRSTLFKGEAAPFVMELPPYRMPTIWGTLIHMWERAWVFLRKAGTIIVGISIVLWALNSFPKAPESEVKGLSEAQTREVEIEHSISGRIGHAMEPVMKPIGFDWRTSTAMVGAFAAKEVFVAQLGIVNAVGQADAESESLREVLQRQYTSLQAFCIMLFCLISVPCMVTVAVTWRETGSWKWPALQVFGLTALAYVLTFGVYQFGRLFM